ncbi:MAG: hypothetical protein HYW14_05125 [Planctomycetes bacterium]|nr:hypothetical protein [Planctomycetota bacterium]
MELFTSKICIYLTGLVFFITCFLGIASDVPIVTLAIRACIAAALCLVLSRILFRIFIEFFFKDTIGSNPPHEGLAGNTAKRSEQKTNPK